MDVKRLQELRRLVDCQELAFAIAESPEVGAEMVKALEEAYAPPSTSRVFSGRSRLDASREDVLEADPDASGIAVGLVYLGDCVRDLAERLDRPQVMMTSDKAVK